MADRQFAWKQGVFREIRLLPAVQADVLRRAQRMAAKCGDGFVAAPTVSPRNRARAAVFTTTGASARRAARDNVLTRNIDAARGK